jgi:RNA polymerase sigma-70 factor, ECF subfamily
VRAKDVDTPHASDGDRDSFAELYRQWHPVVWAAARPLLPCDDDADDAVERVFLRILRRPKRIPKAGWNAAYFKRTGRNEALLLLRSTKCHVPISDALASTLPVASRSPDRRLHAEEVRTRLDRLADALPPRCAAVMKLRLDGTPNPKIARVLGISVKAVEKQAARGRALLEEALRSLGYEGLSHFVDGGEGVLEHPYGSLIAPPLSALTPFTNGIARGMPRRKCRSGGRQNL